MQRLYDRGVQHFKFVDRTFNLNLNVARTILRFFRERMRPGLFCHFEMIPDRLPVALREEIAAFPEGSLQFEVGVQTLDDTVSEHISRRQDVEKLADNLRFLREQTGVHIHADLIVGLPSEGLAMFGRGFDRLFAMRPHEIQVGILKRLRVRRSFVTTRSLRSCGVTCRRTKCCRPARSSLPTCSDSSALRGSLT